jgi:hypothetical protein
MKKMNDENDFKLKTMKKVSLFPKKYWMKKYNDGINFEIKMMEKKASMFPSGKIRGDKEGKKQDESEGEGCKHVDEQMFLGRVKMMKNEEDERVLKHKKLDESKDNVKMTKNVWKQKHIG